MINFLPDKFMLVDLWNNSTQDPVLKINSFTQNGYNIYASKKKKQNKEACCLSKY